VLELIPAVKHLTTYSNFLTKRAIRCETTELDPRLRKALEKLPWDEEGVRLTICVTGDAGEGYTLCIREQEISIRSQGPAGAFYAIQTLRQLFRQEAVPCLDIEDQPDFAYRGFYHDVTRGKIATEDSIKQLIDQMAYYKLNSLQLYVEHTFEFEEYRQLHSATGTLTREAIRRIGAYCRENFIDFIPSLSTFGHLFELLELPRYRHLRVLKDYEASPNFWSDRMRHHTIDPEQEESIALIRSLIDQYVPQFDSEWFNICCDETFDLHSLDAQGVDSGALYVEFVKKIIAHVQKHGKKVMMWADILLKYPRIIQELPQDICFLNWYYGSEPPEEKILRLAQSGRAQIVCPGTSTWSRLCENVDVEEQNISRMAEYGHRHGAVGVLNTNWGDWGNPCSLELAMYGLVLGAEKAWSVQTAVDAAFYARVNRLLYENENGIQYLKQLSRLHDPVKWNDFCRTYFEHRYGSGGEPQTPPADTAAVQRGYAELAQALSREHWTHDAYRQEMLLAAEGVCVIAELWDALLGRPGTRVTDTGRWLRRYEDAWLQKNQPNEFSRIRDMFEYCEAVSAASGT